MSGHVVFFLFFFLLPSRGPQCQRLVRGYGLTSVRSAPCVAALSTRSERETLSSSLASVMVPSTTELLLQLSCPTRKDNGRRVSHTSTGTELLNCQERHLSEGQCETNPHSVNVHLRRRMRQLRLTDLQGQKKGKCVGFFVLFFLLTKHPCRSVFLNIFVLIVLLASH